QLAAGRKAAPQEIQQSDGAPVLAGLDQQIAEILAALDILRMIGDAALIGGNGAADIAALLQDAGKVVAGVERSRIDKQRGAKAGAGFGELTRIHRNAAAIEQIQRAGSHRGRHATLPPPMSGVKSTSG